MAFVVATTILLFLDVSRRMWMVEAEKEKVLVAQKALEVSETNYRNMANYSLLPKFVNQHGRVVYANPACAALFGAERAQDLLGKTPYALFAEKYHDVIRERIASLTEFGQSVQAIHEQIVRVDGKVVDVEVSASFFPYENDEAVHVILRDITHEIAAKERIEQQLRQLKALREIDLAILNSESVNTVLDICLDQMRLLLEVDAAVITIHAESMDNIEGVFHAGFKSDSGLAARLSERRDRTRHMIEGQDRLFIRNMQSSHNVVLPQDITVIEGFNSYCGIVLEAKGETKGVLEVFTRTEMNPDREWFNYYETLAGQVAIAIDNFQLYEGLKRSLDEITNAYDATIAGWSRAMDLRDEETEGHTQRVTQMTMEIAQKVGLDENMLINIMRGALLHDMGKLGIPDSILLKPGKLSEAEWEIMRQHPQFAYDMLFPIEYLRPAIDIPFCHHEKWDGSGYPRALKGEEIPLAARIFAVVDVWDALRSDRPYRERWPKEKVISYIQEESGHHFDPEVVAVFLELINEDDPIN